MTIPMQLPNVLTHKHVQTSTRVHPTLHYATSFCGCFCDKYEQIGIQFKYEFLQICRSY